MSNSIFDKNKSDLIIYSNTLDFYLKNFSILQRELNLRASEKFVLPLPVISFNIFPEDLNEKIGKKIEKIINKLITKGIDFNLYPVPPCLFRGFYPENIQKHHLSKNYLFPPAFFNEMGAVKLIHTKTDLKMFNKGKLDLFSKCSSCELRFLKQCRGVFQSSDGSYLCHRKTEEWLKSKMSSLTKGNLLDVGCGANPLFLEFYKEISLKGKRVYLLDPSLDSLVAVRVMVSDQYENITVAEGTAEKMSFKSNTFDIVVLIAAYPHLQNLNQALLNIKRVLKTGGLLIIRDCMERELLKNSEKEITFSVHFRNHNLSQAISELEKCGFEVIDALEEKGSLLINWAIKAKKVD